MKDDIVSELAERLGQSAKLVEAYATNPTRQAAEVQSRGRFLNAEVERLSKEVSVPMTTEKFRRNLDTTFAEATGSYRAAQYRSHIRQLETMLDDEGNEARANLIAQKISEIEGRIAEEERVFELVKREFSSPEEAARHGVQLIGFETKEGGYQSYNSPPSLKSKSKSFRSLFGAPQGVAEFRNLSEMGSIILSGRSDPRLSRAAHGASTLLGADGGFLIPEQLIVELFDSILEQSVVMNRASVVSLINGSRVVTGFDESSRASGSIYGFTSQWINEAEVMTPQKPKFKQIRLSAKKLAIFSAMTNELLADALNGGSALDEALARAISFSLDRALLVSGEGTTSPVAVLKSDSKITHSKESGQAAGTIVYRNLSGMVSKLAPEFEKNAVWLASPSCKPQLMETQIELIEDVAAAHVPVLTMQGGKSYILGREVVWSEHLPTVGTEGDIMLADLSAYSVGIAKEISVDRSSHVYFTSDETAFRAIVRVDAQSKLASTITASNGATLSWLVTLQTRA